MSLSLTLDFALTRSLRITLALALAPATPVTLAECDACNRMPMPRHLVHTLLVLFLLGLLQRKEPQCDTALVAV